MTGGETKLSPGQVVVKFEYFGPDTLLVPQTLVAVVVLIKWIEAVSQYKGLVFTPGKHKHTQRLA